MKTRKYLAGFTGAIALALVLCAQSEAQQSGPQPTPATPLVLPPLHEMLQGTQFPLAVPVPEKPDPVRLYKEAIDKIAKQHIGLAGYAEEPSAVTTMVNGWLGRPSKPRKSKMDAFKEKWGDPPRELKTLEDADAAIKEALDDLDFRFDAYLVPKEVKLEDKQIDNTSTGVGVITRLEGYQDLIKDLPDDATEEQVSERLIISEKNFVKLTPMRNSPGIKAGLLDGDVLKEVGGKPVDGMRYLDVIKQIKGKKGSKVDLTVERVENDTKVLKKFTVTRDDYEVPVVNLKHLGDDVWHLHLETFAARNAAKDVKEALDEVMKNGGKKLIFDLRDNGGGLVDQAIDIAMYMLPEGTIVTQQMRRSGEAEVVETQSHVTTHVMLETRPQNKGHMPIIKQRVLAVPAEMPIVVLVNGNSASASELVSGALKFNNRVKLVGVRTFGKGVGQVLLDLPYGRRLHVTSFYFLPANKFTDWYGVEVDVESKLAPDAEKDTQLEDAVKVVNEMYENGVKEREAGAKREEEVRKLNRELWKQRMERKKEMEEARKKKTEEKKSAPAPDGEGKKEDSPEGGEDSNGTTTPDDNQPLPGTEPEMIPENSTPPELPGSEPEAVPENSGPNNPLIDPAPSTLPGTP